MNDTDKIDNGYWPTYVELAQRLGPDANVLEVGVQRGGGLRLLRGLFPLGRVVGVDHDPSATWPIDAQLIITDQANPELPSLLGGTFDLIIDDASHDPILTRATLGILWPLVRMGGYYVVEDWTVCFKGHAPMYAPFMWHVAADMLDFFDTGVTDEIVYRDGLIIIHKKVTT